MTKISLFGQSGSGKSTAAEILRRVIEEKNPKRKVVKLNVAEPLHAIQAFAYKQFGRENTGQDGKLMQFLASHFERELEPTFIKRLDSHKGDPVVINSDCRNNAYGYLKEAGFVFVEIKAAPEVRIERLGQRGDIGRYDQSKAIEQTGKMQADWVVENNGTVEELENKIRRWWDRDMYD